jgi:hypothetical protein
MAKRIITENEPFINEEFNDRIDWIVDDDVLLHDETYKAWEHDHSEEMRRDLSELRRICENFTKKDFAAVVITAMENYPYMVLQIVAERIMQLQEGEKRWKN